MWCIYSHLKSYCDQLFAHPRFSYPVPDFSHGLPYLLAFCRPLWLMYNTLFRIPLHVFYGFVWPYLYGLYYFILNRALPIVVYYASAIIPNTHLLESIKTYAEAVAAAEVSSTLREMSFVFRGIHWFLSTFSPLSVTSVWPPWVLVPLGLLATLTWYAAFVFLGTPCYVIRFASILVNTCLQYVFMAFLKLVGLSDTLASFILPYSLASTPFVDKGRYLFSYSLYIVIGLVFTYKGVKLIRERLLARRMYFIMAPPLYPGMGLSKLEPVLMSPAVAAAWEDVREWGKSVPTKSSYTNTGLSYDLSSFANCARLVCMQSERNDVKEAMEIASAQCPVLFKRPLSSIFSDLPPSLLNHPGYKPNSSSSSTSTSSSTSSSSSSSSTNNNRSSNNRSSGSSNNSSMKSSSNDSSNAPAPTVASLRTQIIAGTLATSTPRRRRLCFQLSHLLPRWVWGDVPLFCEPLDKPLSQQANPLGIDIHGSGAHPTVDDCTLDYMKAQPLRKGNFNKPFKAFIANEPALEGRVSTVEVIFPAMNNTLVSLYNF